MSKRTTLLITIALLFNNGIPLITFPILTKTFDIHSYGIWIEAGTLISLAVLFTHQGISNALGMFIAKSPDQDHDAIYANALYTFLMISGAAIVALFLAAPGLNGLTMGDPSGTHILQLLSFQILFYGLNSLLFQIYRMNNQAFKATFLDVTMSVARLMAVISTLFFRDLIIFAVIFVALQGIVTLVQFGLSYRYIRLGKPSIAIIRELMSTGFNLSIVSQANWFVMYGDRLLLSILTSSSTVAIYAASYQVTLIVNALGYPYLYQLLPILGDRWKSQDYDGSKQAIKNTTKLIWMLLIPCIVGLTLVGNALLSFLATSAFAQGGLLIGMIAVGVTLDVLGTTLQYIFYVQDKPGVLRNIYLKAAVLNLVANLIAIPLFSYNGAGLTTMLTFAFIFYSLWRKTEMPFAALFDVSAMWRCASASGIMAIWVMVTINASLAGLVIAITGGALIYGAAIVTLKVITFDELVAIPRAILRRMRRTQPA